MSIFYITDSNFSNFTKKLNTFIKKAERNNITVTYEYKGKCYKSYEDEANGFKYHILCHKVEIDGLIENTNWQIVGQISLDDETGIVLFKSYSEDELIPDKFRNAKSRVCDHCVSNRKRKLLYVLKSKLTSEYKQVGSSCILEYTGISPKYVASACDFESFVASLSYSESDREYDGPNSFSNEEKHFNVQDYLLYVLCDINHNGYVSISNAEQENTTSTADRALQLYGRQVDLKSAFNLSDEDIIKCKNHVDDVLAWIKDYRSPNYSEFISNLQEICSKEYLSVKYIGYLSAIFVTYNNANKQTFTNCDTEYLGEVGDKITAVIKSCKLLCSNSNQVSYHTFAISNLYKFITDTHQVIIWSTSKGLNVDTVVGKTITGTIKKLNIYNNEKQTVLTRCKIS